MTSLRQHPLTLVSYREAMTGIVDLSSTKAVAALDFMSKQSTRAFDADLNESIKFVTIACNLNEFLHTHHPLIHGAAATWRFKMSNTRMSACFHYGLIYWTSQLLVLVGSELYQNIFAHASNEMSVIHLDKAKVSASMSRIASACGIANYTLRYANERSGFAHKNMPEELAAIQTSFERLDLIYGWLSIGRLHREYKEKGGEPLILRAFQTALSCYQITKAMPASTHSEIVKTILRDSNMLRDVTKGEWHMRKGNKASAVALWARAVEKGYAPTEEQENVRDEVEVERASGYGSAEPVSLDEQLEPIVDELKKFCSKGLNPLTQIDCDFKISESHLK
jgi:hypothetical protein